MPVRRRAGLAGLLPVAGISATGSKVSVVAIPWLVLVTTGSAVQTGLVVFAEMLPFVVLQAFAAPFVDRFGGRRVSVLCDAASAAILVAVPLLYSTDRLPFWGLCVLVAVLGAFRGPGENAKHVLVPETVVEARVPMERGAGLLDGVSRVGSLVGTPLGGVLAATVGAVNALYMDAASFVVAAVLVQWFVRRRPAGDADAARPARVRGYLHDLRAGLAYTVRDPLLRAIALMVLATNLFDQARMAVFIPVWVKDAVGSATGVGLIGGAFGVGAVLGNALFSAVAHRLPRRITYACCFLVAGSPSYFVLAATDGLPAVLVISAVSGFTAGAITPLLGAAEFERIPEHLRARVLGAVGALAWAGIPVGGLVAGWLVSTLGLTTALLAIGGAYLLATVLPFVQPAWRLMDRDRIRDLSPAEALPANSSTDGTYRR
ncbi:MAG: MFS transporter [Streptosporangiales bacterium]|nr:MFS transporter [Streptosporangiales bacterium]